MGVDILETPAPGAFVGYVAAPTGVAATDRANIQAAMDAAAAAGGGTVWMQSLLPYAFGATGVTYGGDGIRVKGPGKGVGGVTFTGSGAAFKNSNGATLRSRCSLEDVHVDITGAGAGARALEVENFTKGLFARLRLNGQNLACTPLKLVGSNTQSTYFNVFEDVDIVGNTACCNIGDQCNANWFLRGVWEGTGYALLAQPVTNGSGSLVFDSVAWQTTGAVQMLLGGGGAEVSDNFFVNMRVEPGVASVLRFSNGQAKRNIWRDGVVDGNTTFDLQAVTDLNVVEMPAQGIMRGGIMPKHVLILGITEPSLSNGGWNRFITLGGTDPIGYGGTSSGNYDEWELLLADGTWRLDVTALKTGDSGIWTPSMDGSNLATFDAYAAVNALAVNSWTGIVIAAAGLHKLRVTRTTKNAASSAFGMYVHSMSLTKTA